MKITIDKVVIGLLVVPLAISCHVNEVRAADTPRTLQRMQTAQAQVQMVTPNRPALTVSGASVQVNLEGSNLNLLSSAQVLLNGGPVSYISASLGSPAATSRQLTLTAQTGVVAGNYQVRLLAGNQTINISSTVLTVIVSEVPASKPALSTAVTPSSSSLPRTLEPGAVSSDRLQDQTTAGLRSSTVAERMSRMRQGSDLRELPGSTEVTDPNLLESNGNLSSRTESSKPALSQNPAMDGSSAGPLGEDLNLDRGMGDLAGQADQFRSAGQSPGGMSALNPAKGTVPDSTGFTADSRLTAGDAADDPKPKDPPKKPSTPAPDKSDKDADTVVTIHLKKDATEEEKKEATDYAEANFPGVKVQIFEGSSGNKTNSVRLLLGRLWSKVPTNESKDERSTTNVTIGVRGQCPPESMTCGAMGKTWEQLSSGERESFCDEFESELDQVKSTDEYGQASGACDADSLKEPDWGTIMADRLGPYILTDESGDIEIYVPIGGEGPRTTADLVGTLPDPDDLGGGEGGSGPPKE